MKPEIQALCESLGLRFFDTDDRLQEARFLGESQGCKYHIDVPYAAIPSDVAVLIFKAGRENMRGVLNRHLDDITRTLKGKA